MPESRNRLSWESLTLELRIPFHISYGVSHTRPAYWLRLADDAGWGEGTIPPYYGVEEADMIGFWQSISDRTDPFPDDPADIGAWIGDTGPAPARSAIDLALHDRIGRLAGMPLYQLLSLPKPPSMPTSFTISIAEPEEMARQASQIMDYPIIKVKLGSDDDAARIAAIRAARPDVELYVDANAAWSPQEAVDQVQKLLPYNLAMVEQPVPKDDIEGMGFVQAHCNVPVVADESVRTMNDVEQLARAGVQGINIKLMKVGGLTPALKIARRAQELGLRIMLGCMMETSIGVTAMAHLAGLAEWIDLDAPLLIGNDPFDGLHIDSKALIHMPDRPGIGAALKPDA